MDKKTGLNLGYAVFAALAVLLVRDSVANKQADALRAAVAAAAR